MIGNTDFVNWKLEKVFVVFVNFTSNVSAEATTNYFTLGRHRYDFKRLPSGKKINISNIEGWTEFSCSDCINIS